MKRPRQCAKLYTTVAMSSRVCVQSGGMHIYRKGTHSMGAHKDSILLTHTVELEADDDGFQLAKAT